MKEGSILFRGKKLWTCVYGEEKPGTPLLVVHGGPGFSSMTDVISDFGEDRPVYFYDQLGSSRSDKADSVGDYSVDYFVDELESVLHSLGLREVIPLGLSWGCGLISAFMLKKKPSNVKALILSGPFLSTPMWDKDQRDHIAMLPKEIIHAIEAGEAAGDYSKAYQEAMMAFYGEFLCRMDPWPEGMMKAFEGINQDIYLSMWGPSEFTITGTLKTFDLYPRLHEIGVPVLLTCGDHDQAAVKTVKDFQMAFPDAQMAVLPGAAHLHHLERPVLYKAVVGDFLRRIEG